MASIWSLSASFRFFEGGFFDLFGLGEIVLFGELVQAIV